MYIFRAIKIFILSLSATTILSIAAVVAFLSSDMGKQKLKEGLNYYLDFDGVEYEVGSIESFFPLSVNLKKIHFTQNGKPWLLIQQVDLGVLVNQLLFHKKLEGELSVGSVELLYIPQFPDSPQQDEASFDLLSFFEKEEFDLPLDLKLDLKFGEVLIGKEVLNQKVHLHSKKMTCSYTRETNILNTQVDLDMGPIGKPPTAITLTTQGRLDNLQINFSLLNETFQLDQEPLKYLHSTLQVSGFPFAIKGSSQLQWGAGQQSLKVQIPEFEFQNNALKIPKMTLKSLGFFVDGSLAYALNTQDLEGDFKGDFKDLKGLSDLLGTPLDGRGHLKASFNLLKDQITVRSNLMLEGLKYDSIQVGKASNALQISGSLKSPTLKNQLKLSQVKTPVVEFKDLQSTCDLKQGEGNLSIDGDGKDTKLAVRTALKLSEDAQSISIETLQFQQEKTKISLEKPTLVSRKGNNLHVSPTSLSVFGDKFILEGGIADNILNFKLNGTFDLEPLSKLFVYNADIIKGKLHLNITAQGPSDKPNLAGKASLTEGYYENAEYGTILDKLTLTTELQGDRVKITSASATDKENGKLSLSGAYLLEQKKLDLKLNATDFQVARSDALDLLIDKANIKASGDAKGYACEGDIYVGSSKYDISGSLGGDIETLNIASEVEQKQAPQEGGSFMDQIRFNVSIHILKSFLVKGKGLTSRWRGKIKLLTVKSAPLLEGEINLVKGDLKFVGNVLKIEGGKIVFDREPNNVPFLNMIASTSKNDIKANVEIVGRLTKPQIELTSTPSLPRDEILAQLLFGKESSELSPLEAVQLARSLDTLGTLGGAAGLDETLADGLGLDKLGMGKTESGETALKVEKRLFDRVTVELSQGIGAEGTSAIVDMELTPRISLRSKVGAETTSQGLSLHYKYDY